MKALRKPVYFTCGDYTVSLGTGRKEFNPKKERPGLEHYIAEAGKGVLAQIPDAAAIDEGVVRNFMAARFNRQGHLGAMLSLVHPRRGGLLLGPHIWRGVRLLAGGKIVGFRGRAERHRLLKGKLGGRRSSIQ